MTKKDAQREAFEDALFACLMEGIEERPMDLDTLMQQLEQDPAADVPQEVHDRMHAFIAQAYAGKKQKKVSRPKRRILSKVLLAAVIGALLLTTALSSGKDLQDTAVKLLIDFTEVAARLTLTGGGPDESPVNKPLEDAGMKPGVVLMGYQFPAVPEGFAVEFDGNSSRSAWVQYRDMDGNIIFYSADDARGLTATVDTENAQRVERIKINGYDGLLVEKDEKVYLFWVDTDTYRCIFILCIGFPTEEVLALAEQCVPTDGESS